MRTFRISNFHICYSALLTIVILLYISSTYLFVPFDHLHPIPLPTTNFISLPADSPVMAFSLLIYLKNFFDFKNFLPFYLIIYFGCVGSQLQHTGSFVVVAGSLLWCAGSRAHSLSSCGTWALQLWHVGSRACGLCSCGTQALQLWCAGSVVVARRLSCHVQVQFPHGMWNLSSLTRDRTCVLCIGRQILNHWTTREVPSC